MENNQITNQNNETVEDINISNNEIKVKAESYAAHIMVTVCEIALVISIVKGFHASWAFFSIMCSGAATMLLYKYSKSTGPKIKIILYISIVFAILAVGSLVKFAIN